MQIKLVRISLPPHLSHALPHCRVRPLQPLLQQLQPCSTRGSSNPLCVELPRRQCKRRVWLLWLLLLLLLTSWCVDRCGQELGFCCCGPCRPLLQLW